MNALRFTTRREAEARSRAEWERFLGRPKRPDDVTEFLWSIEELEDGPRGACVVVIPPDDEARLSTEERTALVARSAVPKRDR